MVKYKIIDTDNESLSRLYKHLSVQSLLDIKAVNGEVTEGVLKDLKEMSIVSKTVYYDSKLAYTVFVLPSDKEECSFFVISSTLGYAHKDILQTSFESIIKDLPNFNFYSIVYKGNHQYAKLLKDNGFNQIKEMIHGVEKRSFVLLGKNKNAKSTE